MLDLVNGWRAGMGYVWRALVRFFCVVTVVGLGLSVSAGGPRPEVPSAPQGLSAGDWSQIRAAVADEQHRVVADEGGALIAVNPRNGFDARFDADGFVLGSKEDGWQLPVRFAGHGWRGGELIPAKAAQPVAEGHKVSFTRGEVTEWYLNKPTGVEQGFTIAKAPEGRGHRLDVALDVGGGFVAKRDGRDAKLVQTATGTTIDYDHLVVTDARGRTLKSRMEVKDHRIVLSVDTRGAAFPIIVDPTFSQRQKLLAADRASGDWFGRSVAISDDTLVVGAPNKGEFNTLGLGTAYVFTRSGGVWTPQAKLMADDKASTGLYGWSVAISGDTLVVGDPYASDGLTAYIGAAYVFTRSGGVWTQQAKLMADGGSVDRFGYSVAITGDTVVVGAPDKGEANTPEHGAAYVFTRSGGVWTPQATLLANDREAQDRFGWSVAISGDTAVVGAIYADDGLAADIGAAYVFTRSGGVWQPQAKLLADVRAFEDQFGYFVAISGDTVLVGAPQKDDDGMSNNGAAYVFTRSGGAWTPQAKLLADDKANNDHFGGSVAITGDIVVVGAEGADDVGMSSNGAAYVFSRSGGVWTPQAKLLASDRASGDVFGSSLAISGDTVVVGAQFEDEAGTTNNGAVYVFEVGPPPIPTLTEWAMILMGLALAGVAVLLVQRRRRVA